MKSFSEMGVGEFLVVAASGAATPGGGAIAALVGALGGAMASMAANFTVGRPKFQEHEEAVGEILAGLTPLINDMRMAVDDDAEAFAGISEAYKLPKGDEGEKEVRKAAIEGALTASMKVPLRVVRCCGEAAEMLPELARRGNPNLLSDVEVAGIMLAASARAALVNVYANSSSLKTDEAREAERVGEETCQRVSEIADEVRGIIRSRNQ